MESDGTPESVPVEKLHSGDPITDCGQRYIVLESKALGDSCVVLELESRAVPPPLAGARRPLVVGIVRVRLTEPSRRLVLPIRVVPVPPLVRRGLRVPL